MTERPGFLERAVDRRERGGAAGAVSTVFLFAASVVALPVAVPLWLRERRRGYDDNMVRRAVRKNR